MIEVEKKFILKPGDEDRLIKGAEFIEQIALKDIFYDTADFSLTVQDKWLRNRNGKWQLKLPRHGPDVKNSFVHGYEECETDEDVARALGISITNSSLTQAVAAAGLKSFAVIESNRRKYKKASFIIDIDKTNFGYELAEIELMVAGEAEVSAAKQKIVDFAENLGLEIKRVRGKIVEYIRINDPRHFQLLVDRGVILAVQ